MLFVSAEFHRTINTSLVPAELNRPRWIQHSSQLANNKILPTHMALLLSSKKGTLFYKCKGVNTIMRESFGRLTATMTVYKRRMVKNLPFVNLSNQIQFLWLRISMAYEGGFSTNRHKSALPVV